MGLSPIYLQEVTKTSRNTLCISQSTDLAIRYFLLLSSLCLTEGGVNVLFRFEPSTITCSLHLKHPWISIFITIYYKESLVWWRLRVAFVCEYKHSDLEVAWCSISFVTIIGPTAFPQQRLLMGFWTVEQVNQMTVGYPVIVVLLLKMGTSCLAA